MNNELNDDTAFTDTDWTFQDVISRLTIPSNLYPEIEEASITLFKIKKDGTPYKTPPLCMYYDDMIFDDESVRFDRETQLCVYDIKKTHLVWVLHSNRFTKRYEKIQNLFENLVERIELVSMELKEEDAKRLEGVQKSVSFDKLNSI